MDYHDLIEREKRRRSILVQKLDETDQRIAMLTSMSGQSDPVDKWLDEQMAPVVSVLPAPPTAVKTPALPTAPTQTSDKRGAPKRDTPRKITPQWVDLIEHLTIEGKEFTDVQAFMQRSGTEMTPGAIRTGLMNYRKDYGLVSNPRPGFYAATQKGMAFVADYRSRR